MPKRPKSHSQRLYKARRKASGPSLYDHRWRQASRAFLASHPLCVLCEEADRTTRATQVDHVVAHKGNRTLFWDASNWRALCASCHSRKTVLEDGRFG